jgi:uncharacterized protein
MATRDFEDFTRQLRSAGDKEGPGRQQIESLAAQVRAIQFGDLAAFFAYAHDDLTFEIFAPPEFKFVGTATGAAAVREAIEHNFSLVEGQQPVLTSIVQQGDTVVVFGRETGVLKSTGSSYVVEFVQRFTFREGRLAAVRSIVARA